MLSMNNGDFEDRCNIANNHSDKSCIVKGIKERCEAADARRRRRQLMKNYVYTEGSTNLHKILLPNGNFSRWTDRDKRIITDN